MSIIRVEIEERTPRDFCRDLCRSGKSNQEVMAVANNSRWAKAAPTIRDILDRWGDKWRRVGGRSPLDKRQGRRSMNYGRNPSEK